MLYKKWGYKIFRDFTLSSASNMRSKFYCKLYQWGRRRKTQGERQPRHCYQISYAQASAGFENKKNGLLKPLIWPSFSSGLLFGGIEVENLRDVPTLTAWGLAT